MNLALIEKNLYDMPDEDRAAAILHAAELAHQAEVAAETAAPKHPDAGRIAELAMEDAAAQLDLQRAEARADAMRVINRAKARMGHDVTAVRPADAQAQEIIFQAIMAVQQAASVEQEPAFCARSAPADIAKGAAVAKVLGGQG